MGPTGAAAHCSLLMAHSHHVPRDSAAYGPLHWNTQALGGGEPEAVATRLNSEHFSSSLLLSLTLGGLMQEAGSTQAG